MLIKILYVALGGAVGSLSRWGLGIWVEKLIGTQFPWGTFFVNMAGCLAFGIFAGLAESRLPLSEEHRLLIFVGFLGAFTTFSTFAFHSGTFMIERDWWSAVANILLMNTGGVLLFLLGIYLTRPA